MFEMLVQRNNPVTPLTPGSTPPGVGTNVADLSPRSSNSSFESSDGSGHNADIHSPNTVPQNFSPLQRLQFAFARNDIFSTMLASNGGRSEGATLVKPCQTSSSSSTSNGHGETGDLLLPPPPSPSPSDLKFQTSSPLSSPGNDQTGNGSSIFQCPLCAIHCSSRHDFNEHLVTHSQQHGCPKCSFFTDDEEKLKDHVREIHEVEDLGVLTDDEVRTPKTNSQGKMKTFKCKQCGYHAVTKMDFWEHTKTHIRQEKMLTCPKCPFVTEYKHHLEYHLRNHFGSKPFQCTKCPYSCVNKSMLNSHLKSHSNVYQYRCADCAYATKYCHSLKLHLRKYDHKPSMVLNPDGTPNPLPIIDVYGTRRGPKIKRTDSETVDMGSTTLSPVTPKEKSKTKNPRRQNRAAEESENMKSVHTPPASPSNYVHQFVNSKVPPLASPVSSKVNGSSFHSDGRHPNGGLPQQLPSPKLPLSMPTMNPLALQKLLIQASANTNEATNSVASLAALQSLVAQNSMNNFPGKTPMEIYAATLRQYVMAANNPVLNTPLDITKIVEDQRARIMSHMLQNERHAGTPQPYRSPENVLPPSPSPATTLANDVHALDLRNPKRYSENSNDGVEDGKKRKRKGKAVRYERIMDCDIDEDDSQVLDFSNNNYTTANNNVSDRKSTDDAIVEDNAVCKHCNIAFPPVLYALHMRFHSSDQDPFRCNVCGARSNDKVSFFVHLATASH